MPDQPFRLEEATIDDLHRAIQAGQTTCVAVVQHYIARARAYNGVCSALVTEDGAPVPEASGALRATAPLRFPTETVKAATIFPDLDKYQGPPIEFGRMEPTASDPEVQQQYGMTIGMPNSGQINALGTLNLRGERSVTCKGDRDRRHRRGRFRPARPRYAKSFASNPMRSSARRNSMHSTEAIPTCVKCRCTASCFRSRTHSIPRTCAARAVPTPATISISRRGTTRWSRSCAKGRHHLREIGDDRIQRPGTGRGRTEQANKRFCFRPGIPAQFLGGKPEHRL